jgi:DNA-binding PadR family transcriptional regulator
MFRAPDSAKARGWMRGAATPVRGVLLGLLLERPDAGSEFAARLRERLGETWRIEAKSVYRLLDQLEREGLAVARLQPIGASERRAQVVYHPTDKTAAALSCWMETLLPREPVRLGVHAKVAVAREEDAERLLVALQAYERECLQLTLLASAVKDTSSWSMLMLDCAHDSIRATLNAEIDWVGRARARIEHHLTNAPAAGVSNLEESRFK